MKKVLPKKFELPIETPEADACCEMAAVFSILKTDKKYVPWLLNNFIQIYCLRDLHKALPKVKRGTLNFFYNLYGDWSLFELTANPCLDFEKISFSTFDNSGFSLNIIQFMKEQLVKGKYIFTGDDEYFIKNSLHYLKRSYGHTLFINGYTEEGFIAHDNLKSGKYETVLVSFDDILKSFESLVEKKEIAAQANLSGLCFLTPKREFRNQNVEELFKINLNMISVGIHQYLNHREYCQLYRDMSFFRFGIDCYEELQKFLQRTEKIDWRAFCYMLDHKRVMMFRLREINEDERLSVELNEQIHSYESIVKGIEQILVVILKFNITRREQLLGDLVEKISAIRKREELILNDVLQVIDKNYK